MDASAGEDLIGVAFADDRAEGDMIQGLLDTAGIPSVLQQLGVDGPRLGIGLLNPGGGSQRVMVRSEQAEAARAVLAGVVMPSEPEEWVEGEISPQMKETGGRAPRNYGLIGAYGRIWTWSLAAMMLAFGVFLLLRTV
jgi:Putative prokaryotic signal transducing protein